MKIAFVFSGQGAQYPSMFQELCEKYEGAAEVMRTADMALKRSISEICFHGTQDELNLTHNTQPCVLAADLAAAKVLMEHNIYPQGAAGFSLGEYAALTIAGVFRETEVFPVVQARADAMQNAVLEGQGAMAALIGVDQEKAEALCSSIQGEYVVPSNYNSPIQTVVSGTAKGINILLEKAEKENIRATLLRVSGPFHCRLMEPAAKKLDAVLSEIQFETPSIPVYMNYNGLPLPLKQGETRALLVKQVYQAVRWTDTLKNMYADGFDTFIECGPGKTLTGLIKKTLKNVTVCRVENEKTLRSTLDKIHGGL